MSLEHESNEVHSNTFFPSIRIALAYTSHHGPQHFLIFRHHGLSGEKKCDLHHKTYGSVCIYMYGLEKYTQ